MTLLKKQTVHRVQGTMDGKKGGGDNAATTNHRVAD